MSGKNSCGPNQLQQHWIVTFLITVSLTGCFVAPGMRIHAPALPKGSVTPDLEPQFIRIDSTLVNQMAGNFVKYSYKVGLHDILNVFVWEHPEFIGPLGQTPTEQGVNSALTPSLSPSGYLVNPEGNIFFPLVGAVFVQGKTAEEIRATLTTALRQYVHNPQVDVRVTAFRSKKVYVMGEIQRPGLQPLTDAPMSIMDAIHFSGGLLADTADPAHIFVIRRGQNARPNIYWLNAKLPNALLLGEHFYLLPEDVVFVSTAGVARWNRAINQILPTVQAFWFTKNLINQ